MVNLPAHQQIAVWQETQRRSAGRMTARDVKIVVRELKRDQAAKA
jgi:hypothetical protein